MLLAGHLVPVASFLLLLYWTTLAGPVWRTDGGTNIYVYSINSWMDILIYHRRNLISSLQLVKPRPRTTKSCRDYQGGTSTPRCGGPPLYEPSLSGIHYPHLQLRQTLLPLSSVGWPQNASTHKEEKHKFVSRLLVRRLARLDLGGMVDLAHPLFEGFQRGYQGNLIQQCIPLSYGVREEGI